MRRSNSAVESPSPVGGPGLAVYFDALYDQLGDDVYRYCLRLCGGRQADAEDLAQETWLAAWRGLSGFQGRSSARTWLYTIALRKYVNRRSRRAELSLDELTEQPTAVSDATSDSDLRLVLGDALEDLSEKLRQALILVKIEGLTSREAAEILGVPQGTVQYRVFTGLRELRKSLEARGIAAGLLLAPNLGRGLQEWSDRAAPSGLRERVYARLATLPPAPEPGLTETPSAGSIPPGTASFTPRVSLPVTVLGAAGILLLAAGVGGGLWSRPASHLPPILRTAGQGMASVRTARAQSVTDIRGPDGNWIRRAGGSSYWFRAPSSYYSRQDLGGGRYAEHIRNGREGVIVSPDTNGGKRQFPTRGLESQSPFRFLDPGGALARVLRRSRASVRVLRGTLSRPEEVLIDQPEGPSPRRWTLTLDPRTHRYTRMEVLGFTPTRTGWVPSERTIYQFQYDVEIPEALFRLPSHASGLTPGPTGSGNGP